VALRAAVAALVPTCLSMPDLGGGSGRPLPSLAGQLPPSPLELAGRRRRREPVGERGGGSWTQPAVKTGQPLLPGRPLCPVVLPPHQCSGPHCHGGAAYAGVLAFGPRISNPLVAWLAVFGVLIVLGPIVFGLVGALEMDAREDSLTGLANRRAWDERLEEELEHSRRAGAPCSVAMIDLDGFKAVNDRDGHQAGDRLLQQLAQAWGTVIRGGGDFLARLGGDEFGVLAPGSDATGIVCLKWATSERGVALLGRARSGSRSFPVGTSRWFRPAGQGDHSAILIRASGSTPPMACFMYGGHPQGAG